MDVVVGEVPPAADPLGPLDMGATQQGHCGPLVHVLRVQPATQIKDVSNSKTLSPSSCRRRQITQMQTGRCFANLPLSPKKEPTSFGSADAQELLCWQVPFQASLHPQLSTRGPSLPWAIVNPGGISQQTPVRHNFSFERLFFSAPLVLEEN